MPDAMLLSFQFLPLSVPFQTIHIDCFYSYRLRRRRHELVCSGFFFNSFGAQNNPFHPSHLTACFETTTIVIFFSNVSVSAGGKKLTWITRLSHKWNSFNAKWYHTTLSLIVVSLCYHPFVRLIRLCGGGSFRSFFSKRSLNKYVIVGANIKDLSFSPSEVKLFVVLSFEHFFFDSQTASYF